MCADSAPNTRLERRVSGRGRKRREGPQACRGRPRWLSLRRACEGTTMLTSVIRRPRDAAVRREYPGEISELRGGFNRHVNAPDPLLVHPRGRTWNRRQERRLGLLLTTSFLSRGGAPPPLGPPPPRGGAPGPGGGPGSGLRLQNFWAGPP